jgi:hypothetical protein
MFGDASLLRQGAAYLLAAIAGTCAYAYIYAVVAAPPRPPRTALGRPRSRPCSSGSPRRGLSRIRRALARLRHDYGVFATPIVGLIWLWLTDVSVLLGGTLAHELGRRR